MNIPYLLADYESEIPEPVFYCSGKTLYMVTTEYGLDQVWHIIAEARCSLDLIEGFAAEVTINLQEPLIGVPSSCELIALGDKRVV